MILTDRKGLSLVMLMVVIVVTGLLGAGVASFMGAKQKGYPYQLNSFNALQIANAGVEFAVRYGSDCGLTTTCLNRTISFEGGTFTTSYANTGAYIPPNDILASTGTFNNVSRVVTLRNFAGYASTGITQADFNATSNAMVSDDLAISKGTDAYGEYVSLGQIGAGNRFGDIWYYGGNTTGNCTNGVCKFNKGIRTFYVFQFATGSAADGFTFAIMNGQVNDAFSAGGDSRLGELMAYAGDGRIYTGNNISGFLDNRGGLGLRPPKIAVEFDTWAGYSAGTTCRDLEESKSDTRCDVLYDSDYSDAQNHHMAYVFWDNRNLVYLPPERNASISAGRVILPNGWLYITLAGGTSGSSDPASWSTPDKGATITDGSVTWKECTWRAGIRYNKNDIVAPSGANGYYYVCSDTTGSGGNKGKTGSTEPVWASCTPSGTCIDNNAQWRVAGSASFVGNSTTNDDNRHDPTRGDAVNPPNRTASTDYYRPIGLSTRGFFGPTYAIRLEVTRPDTTDSVDSSGSCTGYYGYRLKAWLKKCDESGADVNCSPYNGTTFDTTTSNYRNLNGNSLADPEDSPTLDRTICLSAGDHSSFDTFLFGWTVATGGATQNVKVRRLSLNFIKN